MTGEALGNLFTMPDGIDMKAFIKSHLTFPAEAKTSGFASRSQLPFVVPFWAVSSSFDASKVNSVFSTMQCSIFGKTFQLPLITNTKDIDCDDEIIVLKRPDAVEVPEPPSKKSKTAGNAKGKTKGTGRAKAKPKAQAKARA